MLRRIPASTRLLAALAADVRLCTAEGGCEAWPSKACATLLSFGTRYVRVAAGRFHCACRVSACSFVHQVLACNGSFVGHGLEDELVKQAVNAFALRRRLTVDRWWVHGELRGPSAAPPSHITIHLGP